MNRTRNVVLWIVTVLVSFLFLAAGGTKLIGNGGWTRRFEMWGYPHWMLILVGIAEVGCGLALLVPKAAPYGAYMLTGIMAGAFYTHVVSGETYSILRPILFAAALALIIRWRR